MWGRCDWQLEAPPPRLSSAHRAVSVFWVGQRRSGFQRASSVSLLFCKFAKSHSGFMLCSFESRSAVSRLLCWMKVSKLSGVVCVCVCLVRVGCRWTAQWAVRGSEATADTTVHRGDLQLFSQITQWNFGTYTFLLLLFVCIILTWFIITTKLMKVSRRKQHWYASKLYLINRFTYTFCSLCRFAVFVVLCLDSTYAVSTLCLSSLKNDTSSKMHNGRIYISVCLGYISLTSLSFPKVFLRFVLKQPVGKVIVTNSSLEAYSHGQCRLLVVYLY